MNPILTTTLDYETRSELNVSDVGPWVYAKHPSTQIVCAAYESRLGDMAKMHLHVNPEIYKAVEFSASIHFTMTVLEHLIKMLNASGVIEAHNVEFERAITKHVLGLDIPIERWRDTAAEAAAMALPRKLEKVAEVLQLENQKDMDGHRKMQRVCRPRKPSKANPNPWHEKPEDLIHTALYCVQDVRTEVELSSRLFRLNPIERKVWELDQRINERGVAVDIESVCMLDTLADQIRERRDAEMQEITLGEVDTCGQVAKILAFIRSRGLHLDDLRANTVDEYLTYYSHNVKPEVKRVLELRRSASKSSTKKLTALRNGVDTDNRMRSCLMYHGANTGRWSGRRFQPQNLQRDSFLPEDLELFLDRVKHNDVDTLIGFGDLIGVDLMDDVARCTRGMVVAGEGNELLASDYASIEGRVLAWIAGEEKILRAYRQDLDTYKLAASEIFTVAYEHITKEQRQVGKTAELACGYQGWVGAFTVMAQTYGLPVMEEERVVEIVSAWRASRPMTKRFWWSIEQCAIRSIKQPGTMYQFRQIRIITLPGDDKRNPTNQPLMAIKLPSGRLLMYFRPEIEDIIRYDKPAEQITFMGVDSMTHQWCRQETYGGKLTENIVQAIARDLLAEGMLRVDHAGMNIVFHVHDEAVCEGVKGTYNFDKFNELLTTVPVWASGLPLKASGWRGRRYRKD